MRLKVVTAIALLACVIGLFSMKARASLPACETPKPDGGADAGADAGPDAGADAGSLRCIVSYYEPVTPNCECMYFNDRCDRMSRRWNYRSCETDEWITWVLCNDYDLLGNLLRETDQNGHTVAYEYLSGTPLLSRKTISLDDGSGT